MPVILRIAPLPIASRLLLIILSLSLAGPLTRAEEHESESGATAVEVVERRGTARARPSLDEVKAIGRERSRFRNASDRSDQPIEFFAGKESRQTRLAHFDSGIRPILEQSCYDCHAGSAIEGNIRIDTLDPDLTSGPDTDWWSEVFAVITKGEMPPPDGGELEDDDRQLLVDWLSSELQMASIVKRRSGSRSSFRRMTRYEYNYALQDLLGVPWDFAKDLPPEPHSEEGFENRSDQLHLSVSQFETYHRIARTALDRVTATGDQPQTRYWNISIADAARREWTKQDNQIKKLKQEWKDDPERLTVELDKLQQKFREPPRGAYYKDLSNDRKAKAEWQYRRAQYAFAPDDQPASFPGDDEYVAILPSGRSSRLIFELGNQLPDEGIMRVTVRASRVSTADNQFPSLQLMFGWQASNEGRALLRVSKEDQPVKAGPKHPQTIQWDVPLGEIYPRNSVRKTSPMGATPSPSEYIRLVNSSASPSEIQIHHVQVAAPVLDRWPPASHRRIFFESDKASDEILYAREIIAEFMSRAWRRSVSEEEISRKLARFVTMRPQCEIFEEAVVEVLATVLSSPQFLYVANTVDEETTGTVDAEMTGESRDRQMLDAHALASRLSLFLWCSIPDQELLALAKEGRLTERDVLAAQVRRMLDDPRSARFAKHFVRQWLDMQLLEFLDFKQHLPGFDPLLKEAMRHEPVALFGQMLREDASVLDFIHGDYAMVNERLARHYGLSGIYGNHFRRVSLDNEFRRGGLLTQAGLLAMNSDWPDSHPLKRAVWLLESLLNDPPPPPPPAVPQIDLADPEIAKMTLKERIEDHRNHAACMSCHSKIDPWGIAFENYDALGQWRDEIRGKPIDAASELFNHQKLDGMDGLKRFLLLNRQDQFVRAIVSKLTTYALGRPLVFADRAEIDAITARVRGNGDGLRAAVEAIVQSELFRSK